MAFEQDKFLAKTVTKNDQQDVNNAGVFQVLVPFMGGVNTNEALPPSLPMKWSTKKDKILKSTVYQEPMWAAALSIAITKMSSMSWEITGHDKPTTTARLQKMLLNADGAHVGWVTFLSKHLRDFLTTDNGAFIEVVRAKKSAGSRIVGIKHLDSSRCVRTGDPKYPVIYQDRKGQEHKLRDYQVIALSDMPDPSDTYFGVGLCAANRAYRAIYKLASIEGYLAEKVSGLRPLAIYIVNGVLDQQLKSAIQAAKSEETARGLVSYMGAVIIGVPEDTPPQLVTIPLAELPERFQRKQEFDISVLTYADTLGIDIQDLQPLGGQAMGTGVQSKILHDKTRGKGLSAWRMMFQHAINNYLIGEKSGLTFKFVERDFRDMEHAVAVSQSRAQVAATRISSGITVPEQELQWLVAEDELPKAFLEGRESLVGETLTDTENPNDQPPPTQTQLINPNRPAPQVWGNPPEGAPMQLESPNSEGVSEIDESFPPKVWGLKEADIPMDDITSLLPKNVQQAAQRIYSHVSGKDNGSTT